MGAAHAAQFAALIAPYNSGTKFREFPAINYACRSGPLAAFHY
jgi:hypothetical protein